MPYLYFSAFQLVSTHCFSISHIRINSTLNKICDLTPGLGATLKKLLPGICSNITVPVIINQNQLINCDAVIGYFAVYRLCFALACFYFLFMVIMVFVRSSRDPRAMLQNGLLICILRDEDLIFL